MSIMDQIGPPRQTANIFVLFNALETLCIPQYIFSVNVRKSCKYIHFAVRSFAVRSQGSARSAAAR